MKMCRMLKRGFSLIELLIVVAVIGVLAGIAIPRFMMTTAKSKQAEAKGILKQIYIGQRIYHQQYNTYTANGQSASAGGSFIALDVEVMVSARYTYVIVADSTSFTATATANLDDDITIDTWIIDESGNLQCTANDAKT
jgi:type IV pilus assembly protein PilE